jgi:2-dehydro-3-deoxyphosphogluconate aldolase/(4S)-4-hydroxy-2-oxoglutarate aldolase
MVAHIIETTGVVPVVVLKSAHDAQPLADALFAGGISLMEVTFRTTAAAQAIGILAEDPRLVVGAGTVLTEAHLEDALAAGAKFIVTPGFSRKIVRACLAAGVPVFPGVATATEIQAALEEGLRTVKFFPAGTSGGAAAVKALSAPFTTMHFIPTGGITADNMDDYLRLPSVLAIGGTWMVAPDLITAGNYDAVTALSRDALEHVARNRPNVLRGVNS